MGKLLARQGRHNGMRWDYLICGEGGRTMGNISVFCHEFGHMLGLPDLYARRENLGMEGVGIWSAMANQAGVGRSAEEAAHLARRQRQAHPGRIARHQRAGGTDIAIGCRAISEPR